MSLQISEMNTQLAQARLKTDKDKDEARKLQEELAAVKKVGRLSLWSQTMSSVTL